MPRRIKVDHKKLIQMVTDKADQKSIMDHFGFATSTQLKVAYANALMQTGEVAEIKKSRGRKAKKAVSMQVAVGKRGSIVIPKALIADLAFKEGDGFIVKRTKAGISLSQK